MVAIENIINKVFLALVCFDLVYTLSQKSYTQENQNQDTREQQSHSNNNEEQDTRTENEPQQSHKGSAENQRRVNNPDEIPYFITIQYCNKSGLHTTFENLQSTIYRDYKDLPIEIQGEEYPLPANNKMFAQLVIYVQYGVMALFFGYKYIFQYLSIPIPAIVNQIAEKKFIIFMVVFLGAQQLQSYFLTTGGFRVLMDQSVIYESFGSQVNFEKILNELAKKIMK